MKILIFCPYYPPHTGGLENHADEFNMHLSSHVSKIKVFTPQIPSDAPTNEIRFGNVEIVRFPAFEIVPNYPMPKLWSTNFWKLFCKLFKEDHDIVISRTRFFLTSLLALIYTKIKRRRWIHIEHGSDFVKLSSSFKNLIAKLYDYTFGLLIFKSSDLNISISKAVQKFVQKFDKRESPVIYRGLNTAKIDEILPDLELKEKYKDKTIISFVGRLYKWKGVENSINAIKSLPEEIKSNIIFLIAGNGEDFEHLQEISKNEPAIKFLGETTHQQSIGLLKISDIYLHSAYPGGGLSTSLLEAMYCGTTIIATPNEGANEVIQDNISGIIIKNPKEITEKLTNMIKNESIRKSFSEKAIDQIKKNFNWNSSIMTYKKIFNITEK